MTTTLSGGVASPSSYTTLGARIAFWLIMGFCLAGLGVIYLGLTPAKMAERQRMMQEYAAGFCGSPGKNVVLPQGEVCGGTVVVIYFGHPEKHKIYDIRYIRSDWEAVPYRLEFDNQFYLSEIPVGCWIEALAGGEYFCEFIPRTPAAARNDPDG